MQVKSKHNVGILRITGAAAVLMLSSLPAIANAANGLLVWIDQRHSALLLECAENGCPTIPNAKTGETYTFVIPAAMKAATDKLKEGQPLIVVYEVTPENAYRIVGVK